MPLAVSTALIFVGKEPSTACYTHFIMHTEIAECNAQDGLRRRWHLSSLACRPARLRVPEASVSLRNQHAMPTSNVVSNTGPYVALSALPHRALGWKLPSCFALMRYRAIMCCEACSASLASPGRQAAPPILGVRTAACLNKQPSAL